MNVLVCIGNNLKYDTRVKRHTKSIANHGHRVHVVACPVPDANYGLEEKSSMTHVFCEYKPQDHPINDEILDFAKLFGLDKIFLNSFPILACHSYYNVPDLEKYTEKLNCHVSGGRWRDITSRVSEEMEDVKALSYPLCFFERAVQYAEEVLKYEAEVVLCNDVDTLLAGVVHKMKYGSRLIYDFHDLMADISDGVFPQMYSNVLALFEKQMIQYADDVMSVSESELIWSMQHYDFKAYAVPMLNCSDTTQSLSVLPIKENPKEIRVYYHGMCDSSRGLLELISAIKQFNEFKLVLRCLPSALLDEIKKRVCEEHLEDKVLFLEPVSAEKIPEMANKDGDVGFAFCHTEKCLNWCFALQNKFIEYTKAGLPIITSPTKEHARIVRQHHIGWVLNENTSNGIVEVLKQVLIDRGEISKMSKRSFSVAENIFDWERYDKILNAVIMGDNNLIKKSAVTIRKNQIQLLKWEREDIKNWKS